MSSQERAQKARERTRRVLAQRREAARLEAAAQDARLAASLESSVRLVDEQDRELDETQDAERAAIATKLLELRVRASENPLRDTETGQDRILSPKIAATRRTDDYEAIYENRLREAFVVQDASGKRFYAFSSFANLHSDFTPQQWLPFELAEPLPESAYADAPLRTHVLVDVFTQFHLVTGADASRQRAYLAHARRPCQHTAEESCVHEEGEPTSEAADVYSKINSFYVCYPSRSDEAWREHSELLAETQRLCSEHLRRGYDQHIQSIAASLPAKRRESEISDVSPQLAA